MHVSLRALCLPSSEDMDIWIRREGNVCVQKLFFFIEYVSCFLSKSTLSANGHKIQMQQIELKEF